MMNNYFSLIDKYHFPPIAPHPPFRSSNNGYNDISNSSETSSLCSSKDFISSGTNGLLGEGSRTPRPIPEIGITDEQLITIKTKQLNRLLKGVSKERQREIKYERRTLKNRGYADSSRKKRLLEKEFLEKKLQDIDAEIEEKKSQIGQFKQDICNYEIKCDALLRTLDPLPGGHEFKENIRKLALEKVPNSNDKMREIVMHLGISTKFSRPG
ncbi:MAFB [Lepeophtheirus salmonis]|uniref:MAFB n=1 Tax=Lepeophtheirus salmonis TaxID=72036 RepID=D3PFY7_LEPSM|nr:transcription factor MafB-like [Lepeophtheirus salmonis]XP_040571386.1 transcription factor MafB-like [Lepeophtheirus salmonis]ADD24183.1 Transcription factor Maf [Lepeophtheirus salmonis]ADD38852.1 Transcription factor Maf [Lepeophtheirus salmonis]CAB4054524.1 MAFB [Lepeophtheirus salmonis]CAF2758332.1 MAFB [Lepeophtheirus salmonis]